MPRPPQSKQQKPQRVDVSGSAAPLTQSPFAALAGASSPSIKPAAVTGGGPAPSPVAAKQRSRGRLILRRETKHRGGKTVVLISGFAGLTGGGEERLSEVEKLLKQRLGCGGSFDGAAGEILIQGDRPADVAALLVELGYEVAGVTKAPGR